MKKLSSPPWIILMDVIFVAVYILAFSQSPNMKIVLPEKKWVKESMVAVGIDQDKKIEYWFNAQNQQWETLESFPKPSRRFSFMIGNIDCESNAFCAKILPLQGKKKKIYITGDLYDEVSGMISDSCLKFPQECSNVTYHITENGTVDREQLKRDYRIFRHILKEEKN